MSNLVIEAHDLGIKFELRKKSFLKDVLRSLKYQNDGLEQEFWALSGISFQVAEGGTLGIIGKNGAGKTTLLRMIAQVYPPDQGTMRIRGKITSLLGMGLGFMPNLSGLENIYLDGIFLGLKEKEIDQKLDEIVEFADLGRFIRVPVRNYSAGMVARLSFSIAVHMDPEILLIDEGLGAGDKDFSKKAALKMREFVKSAKSLVIATHDMTMIREFCDQVLWLEHGKVVQFGSMDKVVKDYMSS